MAPRADTLLAERGLFESRAKAREAIEAGLVRADGRVVKKPSEDIAPDAELSRGGALPLGLARRRQAGPCAGDFWRRPERALLPRCRRFDGRLHRCAADARRAPCRRRRCRPWTIASAHKERRARHRAGAARRPRAGRAAHLAEPPSLIVCDASFISLALILPNVLALAAPDATLDRADQAAVRGGARGGEKGRRARRFGA